MLEFICTRTESGASGDHKCSLVLLSQANEIENEQTRTKPREVSAAILMPFIMIASLGPRERVPASILLRRGNYWHLLDKRQTKYKDIPALAMSSCCVSLAILEPCVW